KDLAALDDARRKRSVIAHLDLYGFDDGRPRGVVFVAPFGIKHSDKDEDGRANATEDDASGSLVSRPEGFHLQPLVERCGSLSTHTAPIKRGLATFRLCQCANRSGCRSAIRSTKRLARILCPFNRLYFRIAQAINVSSKCLKTG